MIKYSLIACLLITAGAQAVNVSGNIYTQAWYDSLDPYIIVGECTIPGGNFLTIMPGVQVRFDSTYGITVNGGLCAHGAPGDSVRFVRNAGNPDNWKYIRFQSGSIGDSSLLEYCIMEYGQKAVWAVGGTVRIQHCHIKNFSGSPIEGDNATVNIKHCNIHNNGGAGINLDNCVLNMDTTSIRYCGGSGDGIDITGGSMNINGGYIGLNTCYGIDALQIGASTIQDLEIASNGLHGIKINTSGSLTAIRLLIHHNDDHGMSLISTPLNSNSRNLTISSNGSSGISSSGATIALHSSIIDRNLQYGVYIQTGSASLSYNDVWSNGVANYFNCVGSTGSISDDPDYVLLANPPSPSDFHLLEGSPCVDTGNPNTAFNDPDGTRNDMGAFYYDQTPVLPLPEISAPRDFRILSAHPNPFNSSTVVTYELRAASYVTITVWDPVGRYITQLVNDWRPAGVHTTTFEGSGLASGSYILRLQAGDFSDAIPCTLIK